MYADHRPAELSVSLVPFCQCMRLDDYEGGDKDARLTWRDGEYDVLSTEAVYVAVAEHRRACRLQPDLLVSAPASAESDEDAPEQPWGGGGA